MGVGGLRLAGGFIEGGSAWAWKAEQNCGVVFSQQPTELMTELSGLLGSAPECDVASVGGLRMTKSF